MFWRSISRTAALAAFLAAGLAGQVTRVHWRRFEPEPAGPGAAVTRVVWRIRAGAVPWPLLRAHCSPHGVNALVLRHSLVCAFTRGRCYDSTPAVCTNWRTGANEECDHHTAVPLRRVAIRSLQPLPDFPRYYCPGLDSVW